MRIGRDLEIAALLRNKCHFSVRHTRGRVSGEEEFSLSKKAFGVLMCVCVCALSLRCVLLFATPWTVACQIPLSRGFSRQEYWSGLPFYSPRDVCSSGIELTSLVSPALAGEFFTTAGFSAVENNWIVEIETDTLDTAHSLIFFTHLLNIYYF